MVITGRIAKELGTREGVSGVTQKPWKIATYLLETVEMYPKRMVFEVSDGDSGRIARLGIREGLEMSVWFDIDAHEYEGRWFNQIRAYDAREIKK